MTFYFTKSTPQRSQKHNPHDVNMYVMELENGLFLDARNRGNVSRFINHGCDPNW